jgi:hypothetical protein
MESSRLTRNEKTAPTEILLALPGIEAWKVLP